MVGSPAGPRLGLPRPRGRIVAAVDARASSSPGRALCVGLLAIAGLLAAYHLLRSSRRRDGCAGSIMPIFAMIAGTYTRSPCSSSAPGRPAHRRDLGVAASHAGQARRPRLVRLDLHSLSSRSTWCWLDRPGGARAVHREPGVERWYACRRGGLYTAGVVFHLWQATAYQNAIWHGSCWRRRRALRGVLTVAFRSCRARRLTPERPAGPTCPFPAHARLYAYVRRRL